jgi:hypothetical protein
MYYSGTAKVTIDQTCEPAAFKTKKRKVWVVLLEALTSVQHLSIGSDNFESYTSFNSHYKHNATLYIASNTTTCDHLSILTKWLYRRQITWPSEWLRQYNSANQYLPCCIRLQVVGSDTVIGLGHCIGSNHKTLLSIHGSIHKCQ